jgi:hypothetical protein
LGLKARMVEIMDADGEGLALVLTSFNAFEIHSLRTIQSREISACSQPSPKYFGGTSEGLTLY